MTDKKTNRGRNPIYPWAETNIGGSFFIPNKKSSQLSSSVANAKKSMGRIFTLRKEVRIIDDAEISGVLCERVA